MATIFLTSAVDRRPETSLRAPWKLKTSTSKNSSLFNKVKHSEEWHIAIDATAGVLHPSDPKFPLHTLRNHTEAYLKRKGKINQIDTDARLLNLINNHDTKDIAIAAAAHAMTATSLRKVLHADLRVAQGSYRGLKTWLQCLVAANSGNPASFTDLEASWARKLLPFATEGPRAAEWYLVGMSKALRETAIANMDALLPDFSNLMKRAIEDYSTRLQWLRLTCQWIAAFQASKWLSELARTSPRVASPGHISPEQILDGRYIAWRPWANWRPDVQRLKCLTQIDSKTIAMLPDLLALEGPDVLSGAKKTLREGLVARYNGEKPYIRYRGLVIHVADQTRDALRALLERIATLMDSICSDKFLDTDRQARLAFFHNLLIARPITKEALDLFSTASELPPVPGVNTYATVEYVYVNRDCLGGEDRSALEALLRIFGHPRSGPLSGLLCQPWLFSGVDNCLRDCRNAVRMQMHNRLPWMPLALELHKFCNRIQKRRDFLMLKDDVLFDLSNLPSLDAMHTVAAMYETSQRQQQRRDTRPLGKGKVGNRISVQSYSTARTNYAKNLLEEAIESFCDDRLLESGTMDAESQHIMALMLSIWQKACAPTIDAQRRELSVHLSRSIQDVSLCCQCLQGVLSDGSSTSSEFVGSLGTIIKQSQTNGISKSIVDLVNLLSIQTHKESCWTDLLYTWLKEEVSDNTTLGYTVRTMKSTEWLRFMDHVECLFARHPSTTGSEQQWVPSILRPSLLTWKSQMAQFSGTLTRLEAALEDAQEPLRCILSRSAWAKNILRILECLEQVEEEPAELLMQRIVGKLSTKAANDWEVRACCLELTVAAPESLEVCYQIWDAHHGYIHIPELSASGESVPVGESSAPVTQQRKRAVPPAVVEVMVAGWIQDEAYDEKKKAVMQSFAEVLGIKVHHVSVPHPTLKEAMVFWQKIESEIVEETSRLEVIRESLARKDPTGTALLLESFGIQSAFLDNEMLGLPAGAIDMIEKVSDLEVEISFPLSKYTELQRNAMGIPKEAKAIIIRVFVDYGKRILPPRFCTHFDNDADLDTLEHSPWVCERDAKPPKLHVCNPLQTVYIWQLNRILHMELRDGDLSLAELYQRLQMRIANIGQGCVACGTLHKAENAQLRRAIPCSMWACAQLWYLLPLEVRIPEIRSDTFAVDAMLTAVYGAAMSGNTELLVGCPIQSCERVKTVLNLLPSLAVIRDAVHISSVLEKYHQDAEKLISWACVHYRGYIATASGLCRIPNLALIHQFVLANASPKLESDFLSKFPKKAKSTVLFHGTTFNRLPAILAQGLRVCSGTPLERTGALHGKGIYLAVDPATALTYAPASLSWRNSNLTNTRLLLGCEVVGEGRHVDSGIHVITDAASVMVRYLFLLPNQASAPFAGHIVPAMASAMNALRMGVA